MANPDPAPARRWPRAAGALIAVAAGLLIALAGWTLWREYDPLVNRRPAVREASTLRDAARARPLSDEEFDRVVAVAKSGEPVAVLTAVAVLELEVTRRPDRREKAAAALTNLQQDRNAGVRQAAAALGRLGNPPPP
jgi:antitoxin (DNA-binding transcriptional repressor) of toxin-antitoxin stability system